MSLNPAVRIRLARSAYSTARAFGRGRLFGLWCGLQMAAAGRVLRYRIK